MGRLIPAGTGLTAYNRDGASRSKAPRPKKTLEKPELAAVAAPGGD